VNFQTGGFIVPGSGSGDKFGAMLNPGDFVLNRNATAAAGFQMGGKVPTMLEPGEAVIPRAKVTSGVVALNNAVPRFQSGGHVPNFVTQGNRVELTESFADAIAPLAEGQTKHTEMMRMMTDSIYALLSEWKSEGNAKSDKLIALLTRMLNSLLAGGGGGSEANINLNLGTTDVGKIRMIEESVVWEAFSKLALALDSTKGVRMSAEFKARGALS